MQPMQQLPIFSDVADWFAYPVATRGQQNYVEIVAAGGTNNGYVTIVNDNYFALCSFACFTNYDNCGGQFFDADGNPLLAVPPVVPNNFTVSIQRSGSNLYQNAPLTQAEVCSSGLRAGKQLPFPVIYAPTITFDFTFTDTTGLYLIDGSAAAIPLRIQMWMVGYHIRKDNWERFLNYYPGLAAVY